MSGRTPAISASLRLSAGDSRAQPLRDAGQSQAGSPRDARGGADATTCPSLPGDDRQHAESIVPNLLRGVWPTGPDPVWVADLTYRRLETEFAYLAVLLDAWPRKVVGYAVGHLLDARLPPRQGPWTAQGGARRFGRLVSSVVAGMDANHHFADLPLSPTSSGAKGTVRRPSGVFNAPQETSQYGDLYFGQVPEHRSVEFP